MNETETTARWLAPRAAPLRASSRRFFRRQPGGVGGRHEVSEAGGPMTIAVVAEKPAVARDIAQVLGARDARRRAASTATATSSRGPSGTSSPSPSRTRSTRAGSGGAWPSCRCCRTTGRCRRASPRATSSRTSGASCRPRTSTGVICATDAGREGELIFRYIYEAACCKKPVRRLWISSLTPDAIRGASATCATAASTTRSPTPRVPAAAPTGSSG